MLAFRALMRQGHRRSNVSETASARHSRIQRVRIRACRCRHRSFAELHSGRNSASEAGKGWQETEASGLHRSSQRALRGGKGISCRVVLDARKVLEKARSTSFYKWQGQRRVIRAAGLVNSSGRIFCHHRSLEVLQAVYLPVYFILALAWKGSNMELRTWFYRDGMALAFSTCVPGLSLPFAFPSSAWGLDTTAELLQRAPHTVSA